MSVNVSLCVCLIWCSFRRSETCGKPIRRGQLVGRSTVGFQREFDLCHGDWWKIVVVRSIPLDEIGTLSRSLTVYLFIYLSAYLFIYISTPTNLYISLYICLSVHRFYLTHSFTRSAYIIHLTDIQAKVLYVLMCECVCVCVYVCILRVVGVRACVLICTYRVVLCVCGVRICTCVCVVMRACVCALLFACCGYIIKGRLSLIPVLTTEHLTF